MTASVDQQQQQQKDSVEVAVCSLRANDARLWFHLRIIYVLLAVLTTMMFVGAVVAVFSNQLVPLRRLSSSEARWISWLPLTDDTTPLETDSDSVAESDIEDGDQASESVADVVSDRRRRSTTTFVRRHHHRLLDKEFDAQRNRRTARDYGRGASLDQERRSRDSERIGSHDSGGGASSSAGTTGRTRSSSWSNHERDADGLWMTMHSKIPVSYSV